MSAIAPFSFHHVAGTVDCETPFRNRELALIARGVAAFDRREASRSSAQGVFEAAKLPQKPLGFSLGGGIQACVFDQRVL